MADAPDLQRDAGPVAGPGSQERGSQAAVPPWQTIAIIGCGLLGASFGLATRRAGYRGEIIGVSRDPETVVAAAQVGAIDRGSADLASVLGALARSEPDPARITAPPLILIATPLGQFERIFRAIAANWLPPEPAPEPAPESPPDRSANRDAAGGLVRAVITDVGSTKRSVLADAVRWLPDARRFVGSHPMAGSEQQGPRAAVGDLFFGKPCITTPLEPDGPGPATDPEALAWVEQHWQSLGMRVLRQSADTHDREVAAISHLPHALSCLLIETVEQLGGWEIASTGLRDTTRLAGSNPQMRADIMRANRDALDAAMGRLIRNAQHLRQRLADDDPASLLDYLSRCRDHRSDWLDGSQPTDRAGLS